MARIKFNERVTNAVKLYMMATKNVKGVSNFHTEDRQNLMIYLSYKFAEAIDGLKLKKMDDENTKVFDDLKIYDQYIDKSQFDKVVYYCTKSVTTKEDQKLLKKANNEEIQEMLSEVKDGKTTLKKALKKFKKSHKAIFGEDPDTGEKLPRRMTKLEAVTEVAAGKPITAVMNGLMKLTEIY